MPSIVNACSRPSAVASRRSCRVCDRSVRGARRDVKPSIRRWRSRDSPNGHEVAGDRPRQIGIQFPRTTR